MKHQQGTDLINQLFTTSSLLLLSLHLAEGKSFPESETQFGGKFGIPSIGGPLNLRSSKSNSNCRFRFLVHPPTLCCPGTPSSLRCRWTAAQRSPATSLTSSLPTRSSPPSSPLSSPPTLSSFCQRFSVLCFILETLLN